MINRVCGSIRKTARAPPPILGVKPVTPVVNTTLNKFYRYCSHRPNIVSDLPESNTENYDSRILGYRSNKCLAEYDLNCRSMFVGAFARTDERCRLQSRRRKFCDRNGQRADQTFPANWILIGYQKLLI